MKLKFIVTVLILLVFGFGIVHYRNACKRSDWVSRADALSAKAATSQVDLEKLVKVRQEFEQIPGRDQLSTSLNNLDEAIGNEIINILTKDATNPDATWPQIKRRRSNLVEPVNSDRVDKTIESRFAQIREKLIETHVTQIAVHKKGSLEKLLAIELARSRMEDQDMFTEEMSLATEERLEFWTDSARDSEAFEQLQQNRHKMQKDFRYFKKAHLSAYREIEVERYRDLIERDAKSNISAMEMLKRLEELDRRGVELDSATSAVVTEYYIEAASSYGSRQLDLASLKRALMKTTKEFNLTSQERKHRKIVIDLAVKVQQLTETPLVKSMQSGIALVAETSLPAAADGVKNQNKIEDQLENAENKKLVECLAFIKAECNKHENWEFALYFLELQSFTKIVRDVDREAFLQSWFEAEQKKDRAFREIDPLLAQVLWQKLKESRRYKHPVFIAGGDGVIILAERGKLIKKLILYDK